MSEKERNEYMRELREYAEVLKADSHARRDLLADAGIVDRMTGRLTIQYQSKPLDE